MFREVLCQLLQHVEHQMRDQGIGVREQFRHVGQPQRVIVGVKANHIRIRQCADQAIDVGGQGRDALGHRAAGVFRQAPHDQYADQRCLLCEIVRREDLQFGRRRQARAKGAELRVHQDGVVDDAHQIGLIGAIDGDAHEAPEGAIIRRRIAIPLPGVVHLAHVIDVGIGLDDLANARVNLTHDVSPVHQIIS